MISKVLAIVGPYPPPFGGISVHIQRIELYLKKYQISYVIYNHYNLKKANVVAVKKSKWWYFKFLGNRTHKLIHFHQFIFLHFLFFYIFSLVNPTNIMISIHNEKIFKYGFLRKKIVLWFLKHTNYQKLICVSKKLSDYLNQKGIVNIYLPAYVPAPPIEIKRLKLSTNKTPFLFSVWKIDKDTSESVYNIPLILEFLKRHKDEFYMVLMIGNRKESDENYIKQLLHQYNIKVGKEVKILYDLPLTPYFNNFVFLVRTNISDGYGISLQEAMDAGIIAIASNVCLRPEGTVLFKSQDINDLENKILKVSNGKVIMRQSNKPNTHLQLIDIYLNLL